ncbi:MAG: hydroxyacid dehydrogenase [Pontiella sp.]
MKKALFVTDRFEEMYSPELQRRVEQLVDVIAPPQRTDIIQREPSLLSEVEIIMSGWGGLRLDRELLDLAPQLEAFFYAGGCTKAIVTSAADERDLVICSSIYTNSIPVAEYTFAQIILCLKHAYHATNAYRQDFAKSYSMGGASGACGGKVGVIGLGRISRLLIGLLEKIDVQVLAYDPGLDAQAMHLLGAQKVSIEEIFAECDVVSLHAPEVPETRGMITGELLKSMKRGASFINTARGSLVREDELVDVFSERKDLFAVLDVTNPEPPEPENGLWLLPNVLLTPHIAGSHGEERIRVGQNMVDDLERYLTGDPLKWQVQHPSVSVRSV